MKIPYVHNVKENSLHLVFLVAKADVDWFNTACFSQVHGEHIPGTAVWAKPLRLHASTQLGVSIIILNKSFFLFTDHLQHAGEASELKKKLFVCVIHH